jgi:flap endonuclease-1
MGLKGVCTLINKLAPESVVRRNLNSFSRKNIIAIDTGILLYRFSYMKKSDLLLNFAKLCIKYLNNNIRPVFIFDGPPPMSKMITLERRYKSRKKMKETLNVLMKDKYKDNVKIKKIQKQLVRVSKEDRENVFTFLQCAGFDVFVSPGEAETMCAYLQSEGIVDYTYTDDSDAFALGCNLVLRNFNNGSFDQINMVSVLNVLGLSMGQFIDMCILCGCDYCPSIPHLGHLDAFELIKEHGTIENAIEAIKEKGIFMLPEHFDYIEARKAFTDFSKFEKVKLKNKMIVSNNINNFGLERSIIVKIRKLSVNITSKKILP